MKGRSQEWGCWFCNGGNGKFLKSHYIVARRVLTCYFRALATKLKWLTFSQNREIRLVPSWLVTRNFFLVQPVERWKNPSLEGNISEHDIVKKTQISTEKCFFFVYHKLG